MTNRKNILKLIIALFVIITMIKPQHISHGQDLNTLLNKAETLKNSYFIDDAINLLKSDTSLSNNKKVKNKLLEYENYKKGFIKYNGKIEHIFFHSLIVEPKLAFDNIGNDSNDYNEWFVTNSEFKKILPLLKERGFVLMKITDIFSKDKNNNVIKKDIYLPKGKKPLILSQDDANYYEYMQNDGFAKRLVLDKNNEVSTLVKNNNKEVITRDGDIVPILDDFIKKNPDFSYKGAKGVLAVTGFEGVLGYNLKSDESKNNAIKIVNQLKKNGWLFASHSYTHNGKGFWGENQNHNNLAYDFDKWQRIIEPIVGKTNIFISPYGTSLEKENFDLVKQHGFDIYCSVSRDEETKIVNNTIINPRFNLDGFTFFNNKNIVNNRFFDVDSVIDNRRPPLK